MSDEKPQIEDLGGAKKVDALLVALFVLLALGLRAWALQVRGAVAYDETYYYILGANLFSGNGFTLNGLPHTAFGPLYPILVGIAGLFTSSMRMATSAVSAVAGALVVIPVYMIARRARGRVKAMMAAGAVAVWPALWFFACRRVVYSQRLYAGSEPLFVMLVAFGLAAAWAALDGGGAKRALLAGVFFGLATLARGEGIVIFAFVWLWMLAVTFPRKETRRRAWKVALLSAAGFAAAILPLVLYVHSVTGKPGLGTRVGNFAAVRPALWEWMETGDADSYGRIHHRLNDDATEMAEPYWGESDRRRGRGGGKGGLAAGLALVARPDWRWLGVLGRTFVKGAMPIVPRYMWPFVVLGALSMLHDARGRRFLLLTAMLALSIVFLAVTLYVTGRFVLPLAPLLAVVGGEGLVVAGRVSSDVAKNIGAGPGLRTGAALAVAGAALFLMCRSGVMGNLAGGRAGFVKGAISSTADDRKLARELSLALPEGSTLMCNKPWIAVWARLDWRVCPWDTPERILKYALANRIDYALLGAWQIPPPDEASPLSPYLVCRFTEGGKHYLFDFTQHTSPGASEDTAGGVHTLTSPVKTLTVARLKRPTACHIRRRWRGLVGS